MVTLDDRDLTLAKWYKNYENQLHPKHSYTVGNGLFDLLKNLLENIPYEERFTPPVDDRQLDKMTVMMLETTGSITYTYEGSKSPHITATKAEWAAR